MMYTFDDRLLQIEARYIGHLDTSAASPQIFSSIEICSEKNFIGTSAKASNYPEAPSSGYWTNPPLGISLIHFDSALVLL
jgi:hypothetical protein